MMSKNILEVTGVILAGGKNSRMGVKKAFLNIQGSTIIDNIFSIYKNIFSEIIIVTNTPEDYEYLGVKLVSDAIADKGSLGGLYTGILEARNEYSFVVACDMPFINENLIRHISSTKDYDIVIPTIKGLYEPFFALYSKNCLSIMEEQMEEGNLKIIDMFPRIKLKEIYSDELKVLDSELLSMINVNTPEDFKKALEIYKTMNPKGNC